jgi:oxygen-independent coproporphyrinogen III oxidase
MAGIYIHIPFCRQACHYCNFHFSTSLKGKNDFIPALLKEMEGRKDYIQSSAISTVYLGGGTPSLLEPAQLRIILDRLREIFVLEEDAEISMEANPDDMADSATVRSWREAGVNRLSIGIQSFFADDLSWMNRAHDASQAIECIRIAQGEGFTNLSIDLIYGGPTLPDSHWKMNVDQAVTLQIPHLSCYALTVEPRTALDKLIHSHKRQNVSPEDQARQFLQLTDWMEQAGYEHYEISNFALPGHRSRHNSSYWRGETYLGLGPSAHSYDGVSRQWNIANNALYIKSLETSATENPSLIEKEILTPVQRLNEHIMISLRTIEGCDLRSVAEKFGPESSLELEKRAQSYVRDGKMKIEGRLLLLTRAGRLFADGITADLFFE